MLLQPAEIPGLSGWTHRENDYSDFTRERLLVHMRSTEGPAMCTGDVNGDGLEDLYLGGARGQAGVLLVQQGDGGFSGQSPGALQQDAGSEDTDCVLFDANGDGHTDLYVTSGGSSFSTGSSALLDRLYLGDGQGGVTRSDQIFPTPRRYVSSSAVAVGDLTGNGHPDLFVGERLRLFSVGVPAGGYLLANDGEGNFTEVTPQWAPGFSELGMITDAVWTDWDGDGREDLVVVGEWMSPQIYRNTGERLEQVTGDPGLAGLNGWWNAVHAADLNGDGREDLVLGNHGLNSQFRASREKPVRMWVGDFEGNGIIEQILSTPAGQGGDYPVALRHELAEEFSFIEQKYPEYADFGGQRVQDIFTEEQLSGAVQLQAQELASLILWNEPEGVRAERLPLRAQLSPVYGIWSGDLSGDGRPELVLGGNLHQVKPIAGPYDASYGVVIGFGQDGLPYSYPAGQSGLRVKGAVREISAVTAADGSTILLIARNNDSTKWFRVINSN
ncbi:MAG: VCBS repeat-containing protein [Balneolaceae bacterium]